MNKTQSKNVERALKELMQEKLNGQKVDFNMMKSDAIGEVVITGNVDKYLYELQKYLGKARDSAHLGDLNRQIQNAIAVYMCDDESATKYYDDIWKRKKGRKKASSKTKLWNVEITLNTVIEDINLRIDIRRFLDWFKNLGDAKYWWKYAGYIIPKYKWISAVDKYCFSTRKNVLEDLEIYDDIPDVTTYETQIERMALNETGKKQAGVKNLLIDAIVKIIPGRDMIGLFTAQGEVAFKDGFEEEEEWYDEHGLDNTRFVSYVDLYDAALPHKNFGIPTWRYKG